MTTSEIECQSNPAQENIKHLTKREIEICLLLIGGKSDKEIASALRLSDRTIHFYMRLLREKLGVHSRSQIVAAWLLFRV